MQVLESFWHEKQITESSTVVPNNYFVRSDQNNDHTLDNNSLKAVSNRFDLYNNYVDYAKFWPQNPIIHVRPTQINNVVIPITHFGRAKTRRFDYGKRIQNYHSMVSLNNFERFVTNVFEAERANFFEKCRQPKMAGDRIYFNNELTSENYCDEENYKNYNGPRIQPKKIIPIIRTYSELRLSNYYPQPEGQCLPKIKNDAHIKTSLKNGKCTKLPRGESNKNHHSINHECKIITSENEFVKFTDSSSTPIPINYSTPMVTHKQLRSNVNNALENDTCSSSNGYNLSSSLSTKSYYGKERKISSEKQDFYIQRCGSKYFERAETVPEEFFCLPELELKTIQSSPADTVTRKDTNKKYTPPQAESTRIIPNDMVTPKNKRQYTLIPIQTLKNESHQIKHKGDMIGFVVGETIILKCGLIPYDSYSKVWKDSAELDSSHHHISVEWYKNNIKINSPIDTTTHEIRGKDGETRIRIEKLTKFTALIIMDCMKEDSGVYECRVEFCKASDDNLKSKRVYKWEIDVLDVKPNMMEKRVIHNNKKKTALNPTTRNIPTLWNCQNSENGKQENQQGDSIEPCYLHQQKTIKVMFESHANTYEVEWCHNLEQIIEDERTHILVTDTYTAIMIDSLTKQDAGIYTCKVTNEYGSAYESRLLTIQNDETDSPTPPPVYQRIKPKFSKHFMSSWKNTGHSVVGSNGAAKNIKGEQIDECGDWINIKIGHDLHLEAKISAIDIESGNIVNMANIANPKPDNQNFYPFRYEWYRNGQLTMIEALPITVLCHAGIIVVEAKNVNQLVNGTYKCRVWNEFGEDYSVFVVNCLDQPDNENTIPSFESTSNKHQQNIYSISNKLTNIHHRIDYNQSKSKYNNKNLKEDSNNPRSSTTPSPSLSSLLSHEYETDGTQTFRPIKTGTKLFQNKTTSVVNNNSVSNTKNHQTHLNIDLTQRDNNKNFKKFASADEQTFYSNQEKFPNSINSHQSYNCTTTTDTTTDYTTRTKTNAKPYKSSCNISMNLGRVKEVDIIQQKTPIQYTNGNTGGRTRKKRFNNNNNILNGATNFHPTCNIDRFDPRYLRGLTVKGTESSSSRTYEVYHERTDTTRIQPLTNYDSTTDNTLSPKLTSSKTKTTNYLKRDRTNVAPQITSERIESSYRSSSKERPRRLDYHEANLYQPQYAPGTIIEEYMEPSYYGCPSGPVYGGGGGGHYVTTTYEECDVGAHEDRTELQERIHEEQIIVRPGGRRPRPPPIRDSSSHSTTRVRETTRHEEDHVSSYRSTKPYFKQHLKDMSCVEGQAIQLECRVEPRSDSDLRVDWFYNNEPVIGDKRVHTVYDYGYSSLSITETGPEDSGIYVARASNREGDAFSTASLYVAPQTTTNTETRTTTTQFDEIEINRYPYDDYEYEPRIPPERIPMPKPVPQEPVRERDWREHYPPIEKVQVPPQPVFEETKVDVNWREKYPPLKKAPPEPVVEKPVIDVNWRDKYPPLKKAQPPAPEPVSPIIIHKRRRPPPPLPTPAPEDLELLKAQGKENRRYDTDVDLPPRFITDISDLHANEWDKIRFEARLEPANDKTMQIFWYHDGKVMNASSRIKTLFDYGVVILEITDITTKDAGLYECIATNNFGSDSTRAILTVREDDERIVQETGLSSQRSSVARVKDIEETVERTIVELYPPPVQALPPPPKPFIPTQQTNERTTTDETITTENKTTIITKEEEERISYSKRPLFITELKDVHAKIHSTVRLEAKIEPTQIEDNTIQVGWYKDGKLIITDETRTTDRFRTFVDSQTKSTILDISDAQTSDSGEYVCVIRNSNGQALSKCRIVCEDFGQPPHFVNRYMRLDNLNEGDTAHVEFKLEPASDQSMNIEWFFNGQPLRNGYRTKTTHEFGYTILDISSIQSEDSGVYECRATNNYGSKTAVAVIECLKPRSSHTSPTKTNNFETYVRKETTEDTVSSLLKVLETIEEPPAFKVPLKNLEVFEGETTHFKATFDSTSHTNLKVEWFFNDEPLLASTRFRPNLDGNVASLDITPTYKEDSGTYKIVASNSDNRQTAISTATLKCYPKPIIPAPKFISPLTLAAPSSGYSSETTTNITTTTTTTTNKMRSGSSSVIEAKISPGLPEDLEIEWFHNGRSLTKESAYSSIARSKYRFVRDLKSGYIGLHNLQVIVNDAGRYTVTIRNQSGSDQVSADFEVDQPAVCHSPVQSNFVTRFQTEIIPAKKIETTIETKNDLEVIKTIESETLTSSPRILHPLRDFITTQRQSAYFQCTISAHPEPTIEWYKDDKLLATTSESALKPPYISTTVMKSTESPGTYTYTLKLAECFLEDEGMYTAQLTNSAGTIRSSAKLTVQQIRPDIEGPSFVRSIDSTRVTEGQTMSFVSKLIGKPRPTVHWFKDNVELVSSNKYQISFSGSTCKLTITNCTQEDNGTYVCKAENVAGKAECTAALVVERPIQKTTSSQTSDETTVEITEASTTKQFSSQETPHIITPLVPLRVSERKTIELSCQFSPFPYQELVWSKDEKDLSSSTKHEIITENQTYQSTLRIYNVSREDEGVYTCKAVSPDFDLITAASVQVIPAIKATITHKEESNEFTNYEERVIPELISPIAPVSVPQGESATLTCIIKCKRAPDIRWYHGPNPINITTTETYTTYESEYRETYEKYEMNYDTRDGKVTLHIRNVQPEDQGVYTCRGLNENGEVSTSSYLHVFETKTKEIKNIEETKNLFVKEEHFMPELVSPLPPILAKKGETATLTCVIKSKRQPQIRWYHGTKPIIIEESRTIHTTQHIETYEKYESIYEKSNGKIILRIRNVQPEDQGLYTCKAVTENGEVSTSTQLQIEDVKEETSMINEEHETIIEEKMPKLVSPLPPISVSTGLTAKLSCVIRSKPPIPQIRWYRDTQPIVVKESSSETTTTTETTLEEEHTLVYEKYEMDYEKPTGKITLYINDVQPEDQGLYTCKGINESGDVSSSTYLQVHDVHTQTENIIEDKKIAPFLAEEKIPKLISPLPPITVPEGETAKLTCIIRSKPPIPQIRWYHDSQPIMVNETTKTTNEETVMITTEKYEMGYDKPSGKITLYIHNVQPQDQGLYICKGANENGDVSSSTHLHVEKKQTITTIDEELESKMDEVIVLPEEKMPRLISPLPPITVSEGKTATLTCVIKSKSAPQIRWYHGPRPLNLSERTIVETAENTEETFYKYEMDYDMTSGKTILYIRNIRPQDEGLYTCKGVNESGEVTSTTYLTVTKNKIEETIIEESEYSEIIRNESSSPDVVDSYHQISSPETPRKKLRGDLEVTVVIEPTETELIYEKPISPQLITPSPIQSLVEETITESHEKKHQNFVETILVEKSSLPSIPIEYVTYTEPEPINVLTKQITEETQYVIERHVPVEREYAVLHSPYVVKPLQNIKAMDGHSACFECVIIGRPVPQITWYHGTKQITESKEFQTLQRSDGTCLLFIPEVFPEDEGGYTCRAENSEGFTETSATLKVEKFSYLADREEASTTQTYTRSKRSRDWSDEVEIPIYSKRTEVSYEDNTYAQVSEEELIKDTEEKHLPELPKDTYLPIVIKTISAPKTEFVSSSTSVAESTSTTKTYQDEIYETHIERRPLRFSQPLPTHIIAREKDTLKFRVVCPSDHGPLIQITWYKDGKYIQPDQILSEAEERSPTTSPFPTRDMSERNKVIMKTIVNVHNETETVSELVVRNIDTMAQGYYECQAEDGFGEKATTGTHLTVFPEESYIKGKVIIKKNCKSSPLCESDGGNLKFKSYSECSFIVKDNDYNKKNSLLTTHDIVEVVDSPESYLSSVKLVKDLPKFNEEASELSDATMFEPKFTIIKALIILSLSVALYLFYAYVPPKLV